MCKRSVSTIAKLLLILMAQFLLSSPTSAKTDNCCFVDRQCQKDEEWVNGYYAYQDNQCGASVDSQQQQSKASRSQVQPAASEAVDNCCFSGWHCNADEEWTSGYFAFQNDHCASQAHWEEQWRKRSNGNRQPRQSGNQQALGGRPRPQAKEQNADDPPSVNRNSASLGKEPGSYHATIDVSNPADTEHELEDGTFVGIRRMTLEKLCEISPYLPDCW